MPYKQIWTYIKNLVGWYTNSQPKSAQVILNKKEYLILEVLKMNPEMTVSRAGTVADRIIAISHQEMDNV